VSDDETIHTENSYKYSLAEIKAVAASASLHLLAKDGHSAET